MIIRMLDFKVNLLHKLWHLDSLEIESKFKIDSNRVLNDNKYLKGSKFQHHVNA